MSFQWHGRNNGELVWEQEIKRYYFVSGQEVIATAPHGNWTRLHIGTRMKITKSQANTFFTKGYVKFKTENWNAATGTWSYPDVELTNGKIEIDVEKRELRQLECQPEDVAPPKRKRKK